MKLRTEVWFEAKYNRRQYCAGLPDLPLGEVVLKRAGLVLDGTQTLEVACLAEGQRIFAMTPEVSAITAVLAANKGLYNGFIAAGLLWSAFSDRRDLKIFFLVCVVMAGIFGALVLERQVRGTKLDFLFVRPKAFSLMATKRPAERLKAAHRSPQREALP